MKSPVINSFCAFCRLLAILLVGSSPLVQAGGSGFFDNFNRPDSPTVGNGWTPLAQSTGAVRVESFRLRGVASEGGSGGIFQPVDNSRPQRVEFIVTDANAPGSTRIRHYKVQVAVRSAGAFLDGYRLVISRTDSSVADSKVQLFDGAVLVGTVTAPVQFSDFLSVEMIFFPDGQVRGEIEQEDGDFHFSFGRRVIQSLGSNFSLAMATGSTRRASVDDLTAEPVGTEPPPDMLWEMAAPVILQSSPALGDDGTFYARATGTSGSPAGIAAFNGRTGALIWGPKPVFTNVSNFARWGVSISGSGLIHGTGDASGTQRGTLAAFNSQGVIQWIRNQEALSANPRQTPAIDDALGRIYFGSDQFASYTALGGAQQWTARNGLGTGGRGCVIDSEGNITYSTSNTTQTRVVSLSPSGSVRWTKTQTARTPRLRAVGLSNRLLAYDSAINRLICWDSAGNDLWQISNLDRPVVDAAGNIFAGDVAGRHVTSLTSSGAQRWRTQLPDVDLENDGERVAVDFLDANGRLYVRFSEHVYCLNASDGKIVWLFDAQDDVFDDYEADGTLVSPRIADGGRIFLSDRSNRWYLLNTHLEYAEGIWPLAIHGNRRHTSKAGQHLDIPNATPFPEVTTLAASDLADQSARLRGEASPFGNTTSLYFEYGTQPTLGSATPVQIVAGTPSTGVAFSTQITGLLGNTTYYFRAVATNTAGTARGQILEFTSPVIQPTVFTDAATGLQPRAATLNARASANGVPTTAYFQFGLTTAYSQSTEPVSVGSGQSLIPITSEISGLIPNTVYHFRAIASNSAGTRFGLDRTFRTAALPPEIVATTVDNISGTTARVIGSIQPNGTAAAVSVLYGLTPNLGSATTARESHRDDLVKQMAFSLSALQPGTTYFYSVKAVSTTGTALSPVASFTTAPALNITLTSPVENAILDFPGSLQFQATVLGGGVAISKVEFLVDSTVVGQALAEPYSALVSSPSVGPHTISARVVNTAGETASTVFIPVVSRQIFAPGATTGSATGVARTTATLNGSVTPGLVSATVFFEWGLTAAYGNQTAAAVLLATGSAVHFAEAITGLLRGTTYHFRIVAENAAGRTLGDNATFTTEANAIPVAAEDFASITGTGALIIPVLANDSDADGDPLTIQSVAAPTNATVTVNTDGTLTWRAKTSFAGISTFTYTISDGFGGTATADVTVTNPFRAAQGLYFGGVAGTPSVATSNGSLKLTVTGSGAFSGKLLYAGYGYQGGGYSVKGTFTPEGFAEFDATTGGSPDLTVTLQCDFATSPIQINGTLALAGTSAPTSIINVERIPWTKTVKAPYAGNYTLLMPSPPERAANLPHATGYARVTVSAQGSVFMIGRLADSAQFTLSGYVQSAGALRMYSGLYTQPSGTLPPYGGIFGSIQFRDIPDVSDADGLVFWDKPNRKSGFYRDAFITSQPVIVSRYQAPGPGAYVITPFHTGASNATFTISGAELPGIVVEQAMLSPLTATTGEYLKIPILSANTLRLDPSFIAHAGYINGSLRRPDGVKSTLRGITFQKQRRLGGLFDGRDRTGTIELRATP